MTDVITLLTFPRKSSGFTALRSVGKVVDDGAAPPARKTPRLETDSDSGSASRYRNKAKNVEENGPITIQVVGFTPKPTPTTVYDGKLSLLKRSIQTTLSSNENLPASHESIYCACRTIVCAADRGEDLYGQTKIQLEMCTASIAEKLETTSKQGVDWIDQFSTLCSWFERKVELLKSLLTYLDQAYVLKKQGIPTIRALAYDLFGKRIFSNIHIMDRLRTGVEEWITQERDLKFSHPKRDAIKSLVTHLVAHNEYPTVLETYFIQKTNEYYATESHRVVEVEKMDARTFYGHCKTRLQEEEARAKAVLLQGTVADVIDATQQALLGGRLQWLGKTTVGPMMKEKDVNGLAPMYSLFASVDGLKVLCTEFKSHVETTVKDIVSNKADDDKMVEKLLDFKAFTDIAITTFFADPPSATDRAANPDAPNQVNKNFAYALTDAFQGGFKARRNKPAEQIAKHIDRLMRRGQRNLSDNEFEAMLNAGLALYRFTDDKDVFRTFYHRALAKRLLLERSASDDFEKAMLKKLKEKYDPEFGVGDHMFKDLALSRETMREFHSRLPDDSSAHSLAVMVLQRSVWPFAARKTDVDLPPSMQTDLTAFSKFYKVKHQGHKLDWDHALGTATLKANFKAGTKELTVSLYQAVVLLLFNKEAEISFMDILAHTRMDDVELRRTLQSLACASKKVLTKIPAGRDVNDDDAFHYNAEFTDKLRKVHINSIQAKEAPEESMRTQIHIEGDRKYSLDAAIVRIMKAKKELHFEQLKAMTIDAVKGHFVPDVPVIKQRIASLVESEYLSRDEDDMNLYVYVA